jgi:hypothetical protein
MSNIQQWYIVKQENGTCQISAFEGAAGLPEADILSFNQEYWGPFSDRFLTIAKRIGLIRAGKCQPQ